MKEERKVPDQKSQKAEKTYETEQQQTDQKAYKSPIQELQKKEEERLEICYDILKNARNELYISMRFLDVALSSLRPEPDWSGTGAQGNISEDRHFGTGTLGTDGEVLYFEPDWLMKAFLKRKVLVNRLYLHELLHCLFCHVWNGKNRNPRLWNLASDIAVESVIDDLYQKAIYLRPGSERRETYHRLQERKKVLTAEAIYRILESAPWKPGEISRMEQEFRLDDHSRWEDGRTRTGMQNRQKQWEDLRQKMQTEMETISKGAASDSGTLLEQLRVENRERYDYKTFLRKFSVLKEEMSVDMDAFDYIFYHYGMETYGNMPLIEPLETKEMKKIEDFVIVIDTSMSCKGELVRHFLEETYAVLSESESFFRRIHVHIIQCDDRIQEDKVIHNEREMEEYLRNFTVKGLGGTDFRPPFAYVERLKQEGTFTRLRGLLYFTDGYGLFPVKMPSYDTAFIFMKDDYRDVDVPPWAMKLIIDPEEFLERERTKEYYEY